MAWAMGHLLIGKLMVQALRISKNCENSGWLKTNLSVRWMVFNNDTQYNKLLRVPVIFALKMEGFASWLL